MKLQLTDAMTMEAMHEALSAGMPYQVEMKANPAFKWQYIQVRKSGLVGVWIRRFDKKKQVTLMSCMPGTWARMLLGGLAFLVFLSGKQRKVRAEIAEVLKARFETCPA